MTKILHCSDAGFACDAVVTGDTTEDILAQVRPHALDAHGVVISPELEAQVQPLIREAPAGT